MIRFTKAPLPPAGGRPPASIEARTPQQVQYAAERILRSGLSIEAWQTLDQLYVSGIMTVDQIGLARRTLRNYAKKGLIVRYTYPPAEVVRALGERFLPAEDGQIYTLGRLGKEILATRYGLRPTQYYLAYPFERILPVLVLNEIIRRITTEAENRDWALKRYSFEQAQLHREERVIFSPSALISLEQGEHVRFFALEYHDEDYGRSAWRKVQHYEDANETDIWEEKWLGEDFPIVLAVFRHGSVGEGYRAAIDEMGPMNTGFYGRSLEGLWQTGGMDLWVNIEKGSRENVFPWLE